MHTHPSDLLSLAAPAGGLILTPCPGSKELDTENALKQLKAAGASAVITLMPEAEMASNAVTDLPTLCAQNGLQWFHLPIEDDHAPAEDFAASWQAQRVAVHRLLDAGKRIAVHCKGGSGRTGLMAAQILVERGYTKEDALAAVKALRPKALSLAAHQDYLARLPVAA
ncbi:MAG: Protein tyrosine/serine phosphatase [Candidatus Accumulibacter regalis]|jgi:protein-tyrosine phosphatase|uniref:protein-tyrosine-phosphatase n=1 Tax=Accumulibacter regalis TaxID=522306 RepID=A0A011QMT5_ACCRE|nr:MULTISPECIES: dual specificity protein phosphatase family protein [unclassified Candidatus Accumulibacter]EXI90637.1 MAG: Protein tyrosine/serine phosphatase [Candidatus Accumulibacter regalis]MBL8366629.1 dual specificity protein phosphatase family protein [Accumulibacter sp.]MBN8513607.1 dual specificity protein phosphatase family protein [Accumulibacter sp.]MBO3701855.1 dual specificity protein phosphatase family protein [Accumulibacter sp.]HRE69187.1 dual specificity protein phosphatase